MRHLLGSLVFLVACAGQIEGPTVTGGGDPDEPPSIKQPPTPKSSTAPGCDGITTKGTCEDDAAVKCVIGDDGKGTLQRVDCGALGKSCVKDQTKGATCSGESGLTCETGLTLDGVCGGPDGQTAIWCNGTSTEVWDCGAEVKSCQVDQCKDLDGNIVPGAYCCGAELPTPPPGDNPCPFLGFFGECTGDTARYCNGDTLVEVPCTGTETCQLDCPGIEGAWCCE